MMNKGFEKRFSALAARDCSVLAGGLKGIEKESLRIDAQGYLAAEGHNDLDFLLVLHSQTRKQFDAYLIRSATP